MNVRHRMTLVAGVLTAVALASSPVEARALRIKESLDATPAAPGARGAAKLTLKGTSDGKFEVIAKKLERDASYEVLVGGVKVATLVTGGGGNGKVRFRTRPRSNRDELLGFDPRGDQVTVRNGDGQDVLVGSVPLEGTPDDGDIICCIPDDRGPECEDRTPAECAAAGGTPTTATSCLPDPCGGGVPPGDRDIVCCIPDDSGPECEDRTPTECAAAGGTIVEATTCAPNPCAATPSPADEIVCCVPDDRGAECEVLTPARCQLRSGTPSAATSCLPDPCGGGGSGGGDDHGGGGGSGPGGGRGNDDGSGHR